MPEESALSPVAQVPIARQDVGFVICEEERLAALAEAEDAGSVGSEYEAVSVAVHLWQAQQQEVKSLIHRADEETRDGYDAHPFTDWFRRWMSEMGDELPRLAERNNALVARIGKSAAEQIGKERAIPRIQEIQTRIDAAESARPAGLLGDLKAAARHDELLQPISASRKDVEIRETDRVRLRRLTDSERSAATGPYSWCGVSLDEAGDELGTFGLKSDQDLSDALHDQFSRPALLGQLPDGDFCWMYKGRYFIADSLALGRNESFKGSVAEPLNEAETRAFIEATLPPPRSHLERLIAWSHEPDGDVATFADVLEQIELERGIHEADEAESARVVEQMRAELQRSHEQGLLSTSELSECLQALGDKPLRRESIPETVKHAVWRRDEGRCVQCGSQERLEFDHIVPFSEGGSNTERNLQLLCEACNRAKGAAI